MMKAFCQEGRHLTPSGRRSTLQGCFQVTWWWRIAGLLHLMIKKKWKISWKCKKNKTTVFRNPNSSASLFRWQHCQEVHVLEFRSCYVWTSSKNGMISVSLLAKNEHRKQMHEELQFDANQLPTKSQNFILVDRFRSFKTSFLSHFQTGNCTIFGSSPTKKTSRISKPFWNFIKKTI